MRFDARPYGEPQLFRELFPAADSGKHDVDVLKGLESGEHNQLFRKIYNVHGFAHIQHKNLTALAHGCGFEDQLRGLGNGHEIPRHAWVGHGNGSASSNLVLKDRDHGSR